MRCDVTDPEQVESAFGRSRPLGPVDILVANAGITRDTLLMRMSDADWDGGDRHQPHGRVSGGETRCPADDQEAIRPHHLHLVGGGSARIGRSGELRRVEVGSGRVGPLAGSRAGIAGVTANVVAPGFIETDMTAELAEQLTTKYEAQIPLGRMGRIDDVASTTAFLASDGAGYITGALIPVDGGLGMGH